MSHGLGAVVTGNSIHASDAKERIRLRITGGNTVLTGNLFENVIIEVDDKTGKKKPIVVRGNVLENSTIEHKQGKLVTD